MHRLFDNQAVWQSAVDEHQAIYEAVADHDALQAQAAMQRHLTRAHARLMTVIGPR
jgi:DNA-binding GntR family transcriptional regulator